MKQIKTKISKRTYFILLRKTYQVQINLEKTYKAKHSYKKTFPKNKKKIVNNFNNKTTIFKKYIKQIQKTKN